MKVDSYKCDQCGKQKGEVNHWWMSFRHKRGDTSGMFTLKTAISIVEWSDEAAASCRHLCGQACVAAELNQFMQEQSK